MLKPPTVTRPSNGKGEGPVGFDGKLARQLRLVEHSDRKHIIGTDDVKRGIGGTRGGGLQRRHQEQELASFVLQLRPLSHIA